MYESFGVTVFGGNVFSTNVSNGTIREDTIGGTPVNVALVSGLNQPWGSTVVVPEPSTIVLLASALMLIGGMRFLRWRPRARIAP
ncbi:MAG TPA: PEP-CTERM sorting domain-containing protein [Thermoguttaceae bacterium]